MNKKQRKTLDAIFATSIRRNIVWDDVVSLIEALGGTVIQGNGSRVRFSLNEISLNIHSPHPQKELKRYQVKDVRTFLLRTKVEI
jgi:hypothetical protein